MTRSLQRLNLFKAELVIRLLDGLQFPAVLVPQRFFLVGQDLHFVRMLEEELEVQAHESPEPLFGIAEFRQRRDLASGSARHSRVVKEDAAPKLRTDLKGGYPCSA